MATLAPAPKYHVGQTVVFVNDYGVHWGERVITEVLETENRGFVCHYEPSETPWFATSERNLFDQTDLHAIYTAMCERYILVALPIVTDDYQW
jgi:hypothetical protein